MISIFAELSPAAWTGLGVIVTGVSGTFGLISVAWINNVARKRAEPVLAAAEAMKSSIGQPNGKGNVVQMLERSLAQQADIAANVSRLQNSFIEHSEQNSRDHQQMRERLDRHLSNHPPTTA